MRTRRKIPRRELCYIIGRRAFNLTVNEGARAWFDMATSLESLAHKDVPKFNDLVRAIRRATIQAKQP